MALLYKIPYFDFSTGKKLGTYKAVAPNKKPYPDIYSSKFGDETSLDGAFRLIDGFYPVTFYISPTHFNLVTMANACISACGMSPYIDVWQYIGKTLEFVYYDKNNLKLSMTAQFQLTTNRSDFKQVDIYLKLLRNGQQVGSNASISTTASYDTAAYWATFVCRGASLPFIDYSNQISNFYAISIGKYREGGTPPNVEKQHEVTAQYGAGPFYYSDIQTWIEGYDPTDYDEDNPYEEGGTSEEGGGDGNFSDNSDNVDTDDLPNYDSIGTGFATLFTPSKSQLRALADVMWDSNVFTALQNLVENITGMFTSLAIVPFEITQGSTVEVTWLGLPVGNIFLTLASKQYYEFDMGSINMADDSRIHTSGSALDYSPFSKLGIFLPFIGFQELDIDECRNATIGLKYRIDILSGTCVALISVGGNTIYQFTGNCLSQIPITNENMQSLVTDAVNVGIAAAATHAASGAASADMAAAESTKNATAKEAKMAHAESHLVTSQGRLASATANAAMGMKPTFGKAGAISASASLLAVKQPYLFLTTPRQSIPAHYQRYCGFPSNISGKLNTFSGFTVVEDIRLNGLVATSPEVAEIYQLLKNGVII